MVGLLFVLAFRFVLSYQLALVLPAVAAMLIIGLAKEASYMAYPAALPGLLLAIVLVAGIAIYWYRQLTSKGRSGFEQERIEPNQGLDASATDF
jgi:hypothetical protein